MIETGETLVDLLRRRASLEGDRVAFVHLEDGAARERSLTYLELDRRARALAAYLVATGAAGERALLLHPQGLDYLVAFFGCLYAGVVAVPLFPPLDARLLPRLRSVAADAHAALALSTSGVLEGLRASATAADLSDLRLVATDTLDEGGADDWRRPRGLAPGSLAFLQYTSGSTADPRGVMVSHANVAHNERALQRCWEHGAHSVIVSWLPLFHDMGLVGSALQAVYVGAPCILMSPVQFLQRPLRWLQAISRHRATTSGGPNFAYDLCVERITEEEKTTLDLSSWSVAFNGAEPVRHATLERFHAAFAACGFRREAAFPGYGLAESTLVVSAGTRGRKPVALAVRAAALETHRVIEAEPASDDARVLVGCGRAVADAEIAIVHPERRTPVEPGEVGEIWISSPSVACGYWRRETESAHVFRATIAGGDGRLFLRTGDLGFLRDGELFVTGRLKDLILVHGRNHYPQDLEWTVESSHASLRPRGAAAFSIELDGEERVVVAAEVERSFDAAEAPAVFDAMRRALARQHELRLHAAVLLARGTLPKTSSGKVQRRACRAAYLARELETVAETGARPELERPFAEPRTRAERTLAAIWGDVLRLERVGVHDNFFELGGDSILAVQIAGAARKAGLPLTPRHLFERQTIAELAGFADGATRARTADARVAGSAPLAPMQRWFLEQGLADAHHWNQAVLLEVERALEPSLLEHALLALAEQHDALRLRFTCHGATWTQSLCERGAEAPLARLDLCAAADRLSALEAATAELQASLDLARGPLLRAAWLDLGNARSARLFLVAHQLAVDAVSWRILLEDLATACDALRRRRAFAPPRTTPFLEWAARLDALARSGTLDAEPEPRLHAASRAIAAVPPDFPGGDDLQRDARTVVVALEREQTHQLLHEAAPALRARADELLLAALADALSAWTGSRTVLVDVEAHGREPGLLGAGAAVDLTRTVGCFATLFPARIDLSEACGAGDALAAVKRRLRSAPLRGIGPSLLRPDGRGAPGADVLFRHLGSLDSALPPSGGLRFAAEPVGPSRAPAARRTHALEVEARVLDGRLRIGWTFGSARHRVATIEALAARQLAALRALAELGRASGRRPYEPADFPDVVLDPVALDKIVDAVSRGRRGASR